MNYIRGAVNAISAPYQYYKDLPPINPSTLTGAIDVIVIQRPTDNGDTELVCSPFHVRFGKWQVLRPGEKKVNVSVNGCPIPYSMKIGEAGEAFFVFETDEDVPEDLITSPILHPTRPDEVSLKDASVPTNVKQDPSEEQNFQTGKKDQIHLMNGEELQKQDFNPQEPEFLDLDALPSPVLNEDKEALGNLNATPKQPHSRPSIARKPSHVSIAEPAQTLPSPPPTPNHHHDTHTPEMVAQDLRVDEALKIARNNLYVPEVEYHHDITLDGGGYHAHGRERSDRTVKESESYRFPSSSESRSRTPSPTREPSHTQSTGLESKHMFRATSEPPPDTEEDNQHEILFPPDQHSSSSSKLSVLTPVQEYSWEWGAFPQPSPMKTSFGKGGRIEGSLGRSWGKGKGKAKANLDMSGEIPNEYDEDKIETDTGHGRSRSVPPELEGSPKQERKFREMSEDHEDHEESAGESDSDGDETKRSEAGDQGDIFEFGKGGKLTATSADPTRFVLSIEGRKVAFELSLVPHAERGNMVGSQSAESGSEEEDGSMNRRGRKNRYGGIGKANIFNGRDEVEAARLFSQGKIEFHRFLMDDNLVNDPMLVIRWADDQYITRDDGSPLMQALVIWRDATRQHSNNGIPSRPSSPASDAEPADTLLVPSQSSPDGYDPGYERMHHMRSKSEPPEKMPGKPTSSSWVQWWSSSRRNNTKNETDISTSNSEHKEDSTLVPASKSERPGLRETSSAPLQNGKTHPSSGSKILEKKSTREIPAAESAPAFPSTPIQGPVKDTFQPTPVPEAPVKRKFAKTLRLTSEQLKTLNLKPGANTITFSLSTSGVIACTARIFQWDSTDLVVISDIDGTITKSDGLGHVFAMIGRDWTHLGVAKLYTDITRNGYKIMYLTSRAIGQADATRDYLKGIKQNDYQLPEGPVIMSPDRLMASLHREVIMRKPEVFKMACLRDIQRLFGEASRNPFYAGFGNRITDALSYRSVNVPSARIFTIDSSGEVKMELLELAGYKSSYIHMTDLVDQMFPPIHRKWMPEFTDFNYWKAPVQDYPLPDFSPPSPALSARSDTSNRSALARLRNFSLVGSRQNTIRMSPPRDAFQGSDNDTRSSHLRQISSFEKLSNTLGFSQTSSMVNGSRRSVSPATASSASYDSDDSDVEGGLGPDGKRRRRERRRSMTSMPGTLDEMHFGMDDDDDDEPHYGDNGSEDGEGGEGVMDEEDVGDEAFDEDLLAVGEMKNVPFL